MIHIVEKDIFESDCNIIVHQVNCKGKMGSGIAKEIRRRFPEAYKEYIDLCIQASEKEALLGEVQIVGSNNKYIANLFGQLNYGYNGEQFTNYNALIKGFTKIIDYAKFKNLKVGIPYGIGCGLGGGNWSVVIGIIETLSSRKNFDLYIYKLK